MSKNGGYKIIDLKNKELSVGVGMVFDDIYDAIEGTKKALLISGLNIEGHEYHDIFVQPYTEGGNYCFDVINNDDTSYLVTIEDTNVVTITIE